LILYCLGFISLPYDCDGAGNALFGVNTSYRGGAVRVFTRPGTYEYHSALHGATGRIVVIED
jgi:hypothetical protein